MLNDNPLLHSFDTPFGFVPFQKIKESHFEPAISTLLDSARQEVDLIADNAAEPDFNNTIVALERAGRRLQHTAEIFFNLNSVETNETMEAAAQRLSPLLAAYSNDVLLNERLFERVKQVATTGDRSSLDAEDIRLLDKTYKSFIRNGALLNDSDKARLREIDGELSLLGVQFGQNVLHETNAYILHITREEDLTGLPDSARHAAEEEAKSRNLNGWVFTLQAPSLMAFLKYAANRELRKELHLASGRKAFQQNEYNNEANIRKIVALRHERARLLGFDCHADFVLQERMAANTGKVEGFLKDLLEKAQPFAAEEIKELAAIAARDGVQELMPWDHAYYAEQLRQEKYAFSEEELKPYFPLNQVLDAAFQVAGRLYGLQFQLRSDIDKYHPEVDVYEVLENGRHKALLYVDFFPRKGKRPGAWMTSFRGQYIENGENVRPHISIVCNFTRPVGTAPSLLTFMEVTTLFHEFGHALHGMLADTKYESLSGTNVFWDFVELPSQFMENYCYERSFLHEFARHYQTGEQLPDDKIERIIASAQFMQGYQTLRQIGFGLLDMAYHTDGLTADQQLGAFEETVMGGTRVYPTVPGTAVSTSFSHIFAGGYAAGYYSYKWAEVLDADAFDYFKQTDIYSPEIAQKFKILLSKGGTIDPMELYKSFRGREPQPEALLKRAGLI